MKTPPLLILPLFVLMLQSSLQAQDYKTELYVDGIDVPWGMAWLPSGDMLVTERSGKLYLIREGKIITTIGNLPADIDANGQGGLLDIEIHPNYTENGWIYLSYSSSAGEGKGSNTAIVRAKLDENNLSELEILYKATPNSRRGQHYGSRIAFDKQGYLFFTIGDRGNRDKLPQDVSKDGGKVYRINDDGTIPEDNPFVNVKGALPALWSYGHRNQQGLAMHPATGIMWAHEHGPRGGDELNLIKPGSNYGWPILSFGINYIGTSFAEATYREGMEPPVTYWDPSIAPSGMAFVTSELYPEWKGHLLVGSLKFAKLELLKLEGETVVNKTDVFKGIGRVRNVKQAPDGFIYIATTGGGIYKVLPAT
jgi:glucose/arabinose dehydrogenase